MLDNTVGRLKAKDVLVKENLKAEGLSSMRCGGIVAALAEPDSREKLLDCIRLLNSSGERYTVLGGGTNTLPCDGVYDGVVVKTVKINKKYVAESYIACECGASLSSAINLAARNSLGGIEELFGIPGTVGGAIRGNAGAYSRSISDVFCEGEVYFPIEDKIRTLSRQEMDFAYRDSLIKREGLILLCGRLTLAPIQYSDHLFRRRQFIFRRRAEQPTEYPSLGSVFLAHRGVGAGFYIDRAGLKGYRIGGAEISAKHAGFIVNVGGASATEVKELISIAKAEVLRHFNIALTEEIAYL